MTIKFLVNTAVSFSGCLPTSMTINPVFSVSENLQSFWYEITVIPDQDQRGLSSKQVRLKQLETIS
jgi:hypothetical protein